MRPHFDLDPSLIYLNAGTHSIIPRSVLDAVIRELRAYELNPTQSLIDVWGRLWEVQKRLATFVNARPQDLFLRSNVTEAMHAAILGFSLPRGSEILLGDLEYGAVSNLCRFRAERDGLSTRVFRVSHESAVEDLKQAIRPETRMVVLSHVATGNGFVLPIRELARETRGRGILLVVDGAHAPGALPLDFSALDDVDAYAGNLHKWMMGPKGTAFGWVPERHQDTLPPPSAGWTTFEAAPPFDRFGDGSRFASRFLFQGCQDFAPFLALDATLDFWRDQGPDRIRARVRELQSVAEREAERLLGWERLSPPSGPTLGPLVSYAVPAPWSAEGTALMPKILRQTGVQISITSVRGRAALRLSPHVCNTEDEISEGIARLAGYFGR